MPTREATCPAPEILIERLCLDFDGKPLFRDVSLRLDAGQTTCILGPSGCGKSTLLKLIAGAVTLPHVGTISFAPENSRGVAWMGQNDLLLPWLTLTENVLLGPRLRNQLTPSLHEKAQFLIREAGLSGYEQALPATLSGGMRQRVALLRTLMEARPVLLMDEPFSALDALTRVRLQNLAARMTRGATVVLVTHDPLEALRLADRIVVLVGAPVHVAEVFTPGSTTPREADDPVITAHYAPLLALLMNGDTA